ncbi:hypothetical protein A1D23_04535 [Chelonobacter oris]|uniref:Uncharacterized protein n=1 Tax=Chelonobacter oris TaxID=505317 RepID=A0A0A3AN93_9PAST|nr:hypothetical protein [Chelonobacter oris]KGQ70893.1 hypothetical protein OA57_04100 [Chelonobacter oris]MDH2999370.1 hypothetical protein [Chelonobacter oris]
MKFSHKLLIALPVAFASFGALADNPINDQIEAAISAQPLNTVAVASEVAAQPKARLTGDNPVNAQIEAAISAQTLKKAPINNNRFDSAYEQLQSKIAGLKQADNPATFAADAQAAKELALQAKQNVSALLKDTGDSEDNYRLASDVTYKANKLNRLIHDLDSALASAQNGQINTAKTIVADLSVNS